MFTRRQYLAASALTVICGVAGLLLYMLLSAAPRAENIHGSWRDEALYPALRITYPPDGIMFPPDIAPATFRWEDGRADVEAWAVAIDFNDGDKPFCAMAHRQKWTPRPEEWEEIKGRSTGRDAAFRILGVDEKDTILSAGSINMITSNDPVSAPIFYREVNLPFIDAVKDPSHIRWRFGTVASTTRPRVVLEGLPVCGNCHSFSSDGAVLGMDVDYANRKGSYAITPVSEDILLDKDKIITWSDYRPEEGRKTFGLLSRISPDGRYAVSTVKDRSVFVPAPGLEFSQLFFPIRGILAVYDRRTGKFASLPGADNPEFVQSNPAWSPDGKYIVFARAKAAALKNDDPAKVLLSPAQCAEFLQGERIFRFDLFRIPFNAGRGGKAVPLEGASNNGYSNYFAKYSPDNKWIVFCRAGSFMLLQPDSELYIIPAAGGKARRMHCNTSRMNSWHSWSPNSRWLVFSAKPNGPFTQLFLTHIDENGCSTPPVVLDRFTSPDRAANIPEFVNLDPGAIRHISEKFVDDYSFLRAGNEFMKGGDIDRAIKAYQKSIDMNPENGEAHNNLGVLLMRRGKTGTAETHFRRALKSKEVKAEYHRNLGDVLVRNGKAGESIDCYRNAVRLDPDLIEARLNLGQLLLLARKIDQATEQFREAVRRDPDNAMAHFQLARSLKFQGRLPQSLSSYRRAAALAPKDKDILLGLAKLLAAAGDVSLRNGREAVRLALSACRLTDNKDPESLDVLAAAYAQAGNFELAVETSKKALGLARAKGDQKLAARISARLRLYAQSKTIPPGR